MVNNLTHKPDPLPMKTYTFQITLMDTGLPYPSKEEAQKDAAEWAKEIAAYENCMVAEVKVLEEDNS